MREVCKNVVVELARRNKIYFSSKILKEIFEGRLRIILIQRVFINYNLIYELKADMLKDCTSIRNIQIITINAMDSFKLPHERPPYYSYHYVTALPYSFKKLNNKFLVPYYYK